MHAGTYVITALLLHIALKLWVTSEACQRFGPDHRSGALELLLSTPLTVKEILCGQMLAMRRQFIGPVLALVGLDLIFMLAGSRDLGSSNDNFWGWLCGAEMLLLVADTCTLCWLGMWIGLTARRPNRAASTTVARVLVLPGGAFVGIVLLLTFTRLWHRVEDKWAFYLGLWFALGMIADVYFGFWARFRLLRDLRTVATQRFVAGRTFWSWLKPRRRPSSPALPPVIASET